MYNEINYLRYTYREDFMDPKFKELFKKRIDHQKFLEIFEDMAKTFTSESIEALYNDNSQGDVPMSFKEVNNSASQFNDELIKRLEVIREDYKTSNGHSSTKLTKGCKKIVSICLKEYLNALEQLNTSRQNSVKVKSYPQEVA